MRQHESKSGLLRFVRNDGKMHVRDPATRRARVLLEILPSEKSEGAGKSRVPVAPAAARVV
jgi:hypothetical protein